LRDFFLAYGGAAKFHNYQCSDGGDYHAAAEGMKFQYGWILLTYERVEKQKTKEAERKKRKKGRSR
jgi:hypothetical protein